MPQIITLTEYQPQTIPQAAFPETAAHTLLQHYSNQVNLEYPTPKTNNQWQLRGQGWVGHIPLTPDLGLAIQPKVPLDNLFRMLELAYDIDIKMPEGEVQASSLTDFYERLAHILAQRILQRARQGLHRAYLPQQERLTTIRGRLDLQQTLQTPWRTSLPCDYQIHTADIPDNQILAWTLGRIIQSGLCSNRTLPTIRRAYRAFQVAVRQTPFNPADCLNRLYHRLNDDYRPLHGLCRFFLEQTGPSHQVGDRLMVPFLINMAALYEKFVAQWLRQNLPPHLALKEQENIEIDESGRLQIIIDLVITDKDTGQTRFVLDTKYKAPDKASNQDFNQIFVYAHIKNSPRALHIYPIPLPSPLNFHRDGIHIQTATFPLEGDLDQNGRTILSTLGIAPL
jgi:5-methylcytosine-specific restriction enzyme subunit McrC